MVERRKEGLKLKEQVLDYSPIVIGILGLPSSISGFVDPAESDLRKEVGKLEIQWAEGLSDREWEVLKSLDNRELMEEKKLPFITCSLGFC